MTFADGPILDRSPETYAKLENILLNTSKNTPLAARFRALFTLKALGDNQSVDIIAKAFADPSDLLRHELAYVLGQTRNKHAIPYLTDILNNENEAPMVRHEAAEALGAIGDISSLPVLQKQLSNPNPVIHETCELAIALLNTPKLEIKSAYSSIDPAPPSEIKDVSVLKQVLADASKPLFERYKAMFALRNINNAEAVDALAGGFSDSSALFRHEIAYVFGQMQNEHSVQALIKQLKIDTEEPMVRHECAEALGSIATPECFEVLKEYAKDKEEVVSESCVVGLDMAEYENSGGLEYAIPTTVN